MSGLEAVSISEWMVGRLIFVNAVMGLEYARALPPLVRMTGPLIDMRADGASDSSSRLSGPLSCSGWKRGSRPCM